jgi:hypothetical protein
MKMNEPKYVNFPRTSPSADLERRPTDIYTARNSEIWEDEWDEEPTLVYVLPVKSARIDPPCRLEVETAPQMPSAIRQRKTQETFPRRLSFQAIDAKAELEAMLRPPTATSSVLLLPDAKRTNRMLSLLALASMAVLLACIAFIVALNP